MIVAGVVVFVALVAGGFVGARILLDKDNPDQTQAIRLVSATAKDEHPFTESVADVQMSDIVDLNRWGQTSTVTKTTSVSADSAIVYGSRATAPCDKDKLLQALNANPTTAANWAKLMGIASEEIEATINGLTPLLLARDSAVINSEYRKGKAVQFPAVLQAGTPVLVDWAGTPRVKCSCGNPLGVAQRVDTSSTIGTRWAGYSPQQVVQITPISPTSDDSESLALKVYDVDEGVEGHIELAPEPGSQPSAVSLDGLLLADQSGLHVVGDSGNKVTVIDRPVAAFGDDGQGGVFFQYPHNGGTPGCVECELDPYDLAYDHPADEDEAALWYLPAGAQEPVKFKSSDDPSRSWYGLESAGLLDGRPTVIYWHITYNPAAAEDDHYYLGATIHRLDDGSEANLYGPYSMWEDAPGGLSMSEDRILIDESYGETYYASFDGSGTSYGDMCPGITPGEGYSESVCPPQGALAGSGKMMGIFDDYSGEQGSTVEVQLVDARTGTVEKSIEGPKGNGDIRWNPLRASGRRAIVHVAPGDSSRSSLMNTLLIFDFDADEVQELPFKGISDFLEAPLIRPAS